MYPVAPALPISMAKGLKKTLNWGTIAQKTVADRGNCFVVTKPYPTTDFEFDMDTITGNEANSTSVAAGFIGLYAACQGQASLFLFSDPQDNTVTTTGNSVMLNVTPGAAIPMGTAGDGVSTQFQLARKIVAGVEILQNTIGAVPYVNGFAVSFTINAKSVVTFASAPANGAILTWAGNFSYLCRFAEDTIDATRTFTTNSGTDQWQFSSIKFSSEYV